MSIATRTPAQELVAQVRSDGFQEQVAMALPDHVAPRRFVRAAVTMLMQSPEIAACEPNSIYQSLIQAATDGLLPNGKEAAIVKFGDKAVYLAMIAGLRKIAADHGWSLRTDVIYGNDDFDYELGLEPTIRHKPARLGTERGAAIGAYAVAAHKDGRKLVEVLTADEIAKVRSVSRSKDRGPWADWTDEMWKKTAGRRLFKRLPLGDSDLIDRVIAASDDPAASAALMYGPNGAEGISQRSALAAGDGRMPPADQQAEGADNDQALDSPGSSTAPSAPDPEPETVDLGEFEEIEFGGFQPPQSVIEKSQVEEAAGRAAAFKVTIGRKYLGKTLAEVADLDPKWITDVVKKPRPSDPAEPKYGEHWDQCVAYARVHMPDVTPGGQS